MNDGVSQKALPRSRRKFLALAGAAAALPLARGRARAQAYPSRPVTVIVFVPAGGAPDILARLIAQSLSQQLGQPFVVDNRPGGGGNLALQAVARAPADGYTLLLIATPHAVNVTLYGGNANAITRDIVPVAGVNNDSFVMVVNPAFPAQTVPEFIAYAKANPGKINMTSSGAGNLSHLAGELFRMLTGIEVVHVPYKGAVPALTGLMAGDVHFMFDAFPSSLPHIKSGKLRAIGVTATARTRMLPEVPPVSDFVPGYAVTGWLGFGAPKGTPREIVERLNGAVNAALAEPAVRERLAALGSEPNPRTPEEFARHIAAETEKWANVVKFAGIKPE